MTPFQIVKAAAYLKAANAAAPTPEISPDEVVKLLGQVKNQATIRAALLGSLGGGVIGGGTGLTYGLLRNALRSKEDKERTSLVESTLLGGGAGALTGASAYGIPAYAGGALMQGIAQARADALRQAAP